MFLLLECRHILELLEMMSFQVQDLTSMDHHLLTSELKVGGHSSEGVTLGGG
jgi:hypothetical protein